MPHVEMTAPISVPDDGRLRPQDNVPHEDWVADVDRAGDAPEPFFSGRDGDLTAAAAAMDMVSRGRGRGQTLCFSGAPGAGKTSLMRQLVGWTVQNRSDWLPVVVGGQAALSLPAIIDAIDRARASVLSARDIENAVRTEAARLRGAAGADDGAADAAATWIANLPDTLPAGPVAWREWAGVRLRDLGVKGRSAAQSAMQFCLDRGVHLAGFGVGPELRDRRDMPWDVLMARMPPGWPERRATSPRPSLTISRLRPPARRGPASRRILPPCRSPWRRRRPRTRRSARRSPGCGRCPAGARRRRTAGAGNPPMPNIGPISCAASIRASASPPVISNVSSNSDSVVCLVKCRTGRCRGPSPGLDRNLAVPPSGTLEFSMHGPPHIACPMALCHI